MMKRSIAAAFRFLLAEGFSAEPLGEEGCRYTREEVVVKAAYNPRDGFDVVVTVGATDPVSVGLVVDAIKAHKGRAEKSELDDDDPEVNAEHRIYELASFLRGSGKRMLSDAQELRQALVKLRFWHVGHWVLEWGNGIEMSDAEKSTNKLVVPEILRLLEED